MSDNKKALASVIFSRGIYSLTWFDLSASFPAIAAHFHYSPIETLGVFTAVFLLGSGLFQIPAGVISARIGAKRVSMCGLLVIAATSLFFVIAGNYQLQLILRFLTGVGTALYFAPALVMVTNTLSKERSGVGVGFYYSVFYLGAGISIFTFAPLAAKVDWRLPFIISSALTFVALIESIYALPRDNLEKRQSNSIDFRSLLRSRIVWAPTVAILGVNAAYYIVSQFGVTYLETQLHLNSVFAGTVSSLVLFGAMGGGPIVGFASDRFRKRRLAIALSVLGAGLSILLLIPVQLFSTTISVILLGFFVSASYVTAYAFPGQHAEIDSLQAPVAIGLNNSLGILSGAAVAPGFVYLVSISGYGVGWLLLAISTAILGPAIFLSTEPPSLGQKSSH